LHIDYDFERDKDKKLYQVAFDKINLMAMQFEEKKFKRDYE